MLEGMPELVQLNMYGNRIRNVILPRITTTRRKNEKEEEEEGGDDKTIINGEGTTVILPKMEVLNLGNNELCCLPDGIGIIMPSIKTIRVVDNYIRIIQSNICNIESIQKIDVTCNPIVEPPGDICDRGIVHMKRYWRGIENFHKLQFERQQGEIDAQVAVAVAATMATSSIPTSSSPPPSSTTQLPSNKDTIRTVNDNVNDDQTMNVVEGTTSNIDDDDDDDDRDDVASDDITTTKTNPSSATVASFPPTSQTSDTGLASTSAVAATSSPGTATLKSEDSMDCDNDDNYHHKIAATPSIPVCDGGLMLSPERTPNVVRHATIVTPPTKPATEGAAKVPRFMASTKNSASRDNTLRDIRIRRDREKRRIRSSRSPSAGRRIARGGGGEGGGGDSVSGASRKSGVASMSSSSSHHQPTSTPRLDHRGGTPTNVTPRSRRDNKDSGGRSVTASGLLSPSSSKRRPLFLDNTTPTTTASTPEPIQLLSKREGTAAVSPSVGVARTTTADSLSHMLQNSPPHTPLAVTTDRKRERGGGADDHHCVVSLPPTLDHYPSSTASSVASIATATSTFPPSSSHHRRHGRRRRQAGSSTAVSLGGGSVTGGSTGEGRGSSSSGRRARARPTATTSDTAEIRSLMRVMSLSNPTTMKFTY